MVNERQHCASEILAFTPYWPPSPSTDCNPTGSPTATYALTSPRYSDLPPEHFTPGRMSYDLRRLRLHGIIQRIPHTHRYQPTARGWRIAVFFTHSTRFLRTGLAELADPASSTTLHRELDRLAARSGLAA